MRQLSLAALYLISLTLSATDYPVADTGTFAICVLSEEQCAQIPGGMNFGSKHSPEGNCLGWVFTTQTLLTHLNFDPTLPADPAVTRKAIVEAHRSGKKHTIPGYANLAELVREADAAWVDEADEKNAEEAAKLHPVQRAMIDLQNDQPGLLHALLNTKPLQTTTQASTALAKILDAKLRLGVPSQLAIRKHGEAGGHAIMAVGLQAGSENETARKFFILDPNHPLEMQALRLERLGIDGIEDDTYWVYDAFSWSRVDQEDLAKKSEAVLRLSREKNPVVKLAKAPLLHKAVEELKRARGALRVEWLRDKKKSEKLLKLAFRPNRLPTDPPDMEQFSRVFGALFQVPGVCPLPTVPLERHQTTRTDTENSHGAKKR